MQESVTHKNMTYFIIKLRVVGIKPTGQTLTKPSNGRTFGEREKVSKPRHARTFVIRSLYINIIMYRAGELLRNFFYGAHCRVKQPEASYCSEQREFILYP